jgi:hypothetical protein
MFLEIFPGRAASPCTLPALSGCPAAWGYHLGLGKDDERCVEKVRSSALEPLEHR